MWRRLLTPIICLLLVQAALFHAPAQAASPGQVEQSAPTRNPVLDAAANGAIGSLEALGSKDMRDILEQEARENAERFPDRAKQYADGLEQNLKAVKILDRIGKTLQYTKLAADILPGTYRAFDAASSGNWRQAWVETKSVLVELAKYGGGALGGKAGDILALAACASFALAAPVCIGVLVFSHVTLGYAGDVSAGAIAEALLNGGETAYCRSSRRLGGGICEPSPIVGPSGGAGPGGSGVGDTAVGGPGMGTRQSAPGAPIGGSYAGTGPPPAPNFAGGHGASVGSTTATVTAKNLTAAASGAGSTAVNNIGSVDSGGRASVSAQSVVTTASGGQAATTSIGTGGGDTIVTGNIQNQGGDLTIGNSGTSRDGRKCIDVYRNTCIIHIYYPKHHSDPCAPGYWRVLNACKLPSDDKHSIPGL